MSAGGIISDQIAKRYGMRGRLWWLWSCQTTAGILCIGLGLANNSFANTLVVLCFFSFFVEVRMSASCLFQAKRVHVACRHVASDTMYCMP